MALPFLLIALSAGAGGYGLKKCIDAQQDQEHAKALLNQASLVVQVSQLRLGQARTAANGKLSTLGNLKLGIADRQLGRFVRLAQPIRRVDLPELSPWLQPAQIAGRERELVQMRQVAIQANYLLQGGALALGSGVLVGVASYGLTMTLASASTGTAIATLSGIAATNATLAWFGGGSLAVGGLGVAGGTMALGLLVAGPALLVGGSIAAAKARENLTLANAHLAKARRAAAEMDVAASFIKGVGQVVDQFEGVLYALEARATVVFDRLEAVIQKRGMIYERFSQAQRKEFWAALTFAQALKQVLDLPLFATAEGAKPGISPALLAGDQLLLRLGGDR